MFTTFYLRHQWNVSLPLWDAQRGLPREMLNFCYSRFLFAWVPLNLSDSCFSLSFLRPGYSHDNSFLPVSINDFFFVVAFRMTIKRLVKLQTEKSTKMLRAFYFFCLRKIVVAGGGGGYEWVNEMSWRSTLDVDDGIVQLGRFQFFLHLRQHVLHSSDLKFKWIEILVYI